MVSNVPGSTCTAPGPPRRTFSVWPAPTNWRVRTPRSTTRIVSIHSRWRISVSTTEATWVESIQCSPSNSSRLTVFQYVWRDAWTRSTSRPSRGHVIGP